MKEKIYLRPLRVGDAEVSYKWRNIPEVWRYTDFVPDREITCQDERSWLEKVLERIDQKRFAICLESTGEYIGNIQLVNIKDGEAEMHMVIGVKECWGKGIARQAVDQMISYSFEELALEKLCIAVHLDNAASLAMVKKQGFKSRGIREPHHHMELTKTQYYLSNLS